MTTEAASGMQWPSALHEFYSQRIPGGILFSAAISACETCGQWLQAMHLFQAGSTERQHGEIS